MVEWNNKAMMTLGQQTTIATTAALVLVAATLGWMRFSTSRWNSSLIQFQKDNHGYTTSSDDGKKQVLLVVCPASGGGKAMRLYPQCLQALEQRGLQVEVYVTESAQDLITLTDTVDFKQYTKMIAMLSGDSSIYEMIQTTMRDNDGKWPYAPVLVLPGGSSNAMSFEFHGPNSNANIPDLIQHATVVKKGSVIKCTSPGATTRYAIHVAFDGWQRTAIEAIEAYRSTIHVAFGKFPVFIVAFAHLLAMPLKRKKPCPNVLSVLVSDREGEGINLNFGVDRFDENMIVIYQDKYHGLWNLLKTIGNEMSGKLGQGYREGKSFENGLTAKVTSDTFTVTGDGHYSIRFDGTSMLPMEGESITFELAKDAIPYLVSGEQDLTGT